MCTTILCCITHLDKPMSESTNNPAPNSPNNAKIVDKKPVVLELEPKTYYWCTCGESTNQPYCNGAHKGTGFVPLPFTVTETKKVALCLCKQTGNAPFCDGAHTKL